jgi:protein-S-isoprenylcysteine O-methyltransferase Ste14
MSNTLTTQQKLETAGKKRIVVVLFYMIAAWVLIFMGAGTFNFAAAWVFAALQLSIFLTVGVRVIRVNPEIINERGRKSDKTKSWDKIFYVFYALQVILMPLVAGLDYRFGWSTPVLGWQIVGFVSLIPGFSIPYWAMMVNDFLTTTVRLQEERGHYVVTAGPYRFVRHPMYFGALLGWIGTPLLLGTWWALVPSGIALVAMVVRTALEDKTLQAELPGYAQYAQHVRYKLLPGIW